jgi:hypothetical protein
MRTKRKEQKAAPYIHTPGRNQLYGEADHAQARNIPRIDEMDFRLFSILHSQFSIFV